MVVLLPLCSLCSLLCWFLLISLISTQQSTPGSGLRCLCLSLCTPLVLSSSLIALKISICWWFSQRESSHFLLNARLINPTVDLTYSLECQIGISNLPCPKRNPWYSPPEPHPPTVFPISLNGNSCHQLLRPKALETSLIPLFPTSHLVCQQILQAGSYIYPEFDHFLSSLLPSSW